MVEVRDYSPNGLNQDLRHTIETDLIIGKLFLHANLLFTISQDGCYVYIYKLFTAEPVVTQPV